MLLADDEEGEEGAGGDKREAEEELEEVAEDRPQKRRAYGYDDLQGENVEVSCGKWR